MVSFELGREIGKDVVRLVGAESEGLRFDSSWGLRIFSLSHAQDKTKNIFLYWKQILANLWLKNDVNPELEGLKLLKESRIAKTSLSNCKL